MKRAGSQQDNRHPSPTVQYAAKRSLSPHSLCFMLYSLIYLVPLLTVALSGYGDGLIAQAGIDASAVVRQIIGLYVIGTVSFLLGSWSAPRISWLLGGSIHQRFEMLQIRTYKIDMVLLMLLISMFLLSKLVLHGTGVYSAYAFDSSMMETSSWTTSMFLSETLAFTSLVVLFSNARRNIALFTILSLINGVNLLHGTRNFVVIAVTGALLYIYVRTSMSLLRIAGLAATAFGAAVPLAYVVYLNRSHAGFSDFSLISVLSPITYESVFSQLSLIAVLGRPSLYSGLGHAHRLIQDIVVFTLPRFIVGNKESLLWSRQFGSLSPLGAFNGFALGLLYFGYLLPLAYYCLGLLAGGLQRLTRSAGGVALYAYFCCDFLYRIQRDGYVIPSKMLINNVEVVLLLAILHYWERSGFPMHLSSVSTIHDTEGEKTGVVPT